jgi:hypothetical protein
VRARNYVTRSLLLNVPENERAARIQDLVDALLGKVLIGP